MTHLRATLAIFLFFFLLNFLVNSPVVLADSKSDYDYQYGLYRQNYLEYTILKKDYLDTPSLDNQQKAMLSAKQSVLSRDLAKASLAWYIGDLINSSNVNYPPIKPISDSLSEARQYYLRESENVQKIITTENLKSFTADYQIATVKHDRIIRYGIIANKIAKLVRIQVDSRIALDDLTPKLPVPMSTPLKARIDELNSMYTAINNKIDILAGGLNPAEGEENVDADIFYTVRIEKMQEILTLQTNWINRLIDLDLNYVQAKN